MGTRLATHSAVRALGAVSIVLLGVVTASAQASGTSTAQTTAPPAPQAPKTAPPAPPGAPQATPPQTTPGGTAAPVAGVTSVASPALVFGSEAGIVINPIKPDKAADYENLLARLREALEQSTDPVRRSQAASWKMLKATEPGPAGAVLFLFVLDPVVKNADYAISRVFAEAYPDEVPDLWTRLRDAYAGGMYQLSLETVKSPPPAAAPAKK